MLLTLLLTLCGLTSQKTHRGGLGLGGSVHEETHPCFPYFVQPSFKGIDADVRDGCFSSGGKCLAEATVWGGGMPTFVGDSAVAKETAPLNSVPFCAADQ